MNEWQWNDNQPKILEEELGVKQTTKPLGGTYCSVGRKNAWYTHIHKIIYPSYRIPNLNINGNSIVLSIQPSQMDRNSPALQMPHLLVAVSSSMDNISKLTNLTIGPRNDKSLDFNTQSNEKKNGHDWWKPTQVSNYLIITLTPSALPIIHPRHWHLPK